MPQEHKDIQGNENYSLSQEDIQRLIKSPFDKKIDITKKIADYYRQGGFNDTQMQNAAKIFRTLVKDTEVKIRKTLADAIKDQQDIPKDVVLSLAHDVEEVSLPVLEFSDILTDEDLIEIVTSSENAAKQVSISRRNNVSESVSDALIETNNDVVVGSLLNNETAQVSEKGFHKIAGDFADSELVMGAMVGRETLPVSIVENLADKISATIYQKLAEKHKDALVHMDDVLKKSRDVATMKIIGLKSTEAEYSQFTNLMEVLKISDDLTPIYALCMGNINVFEVNVARLTKTPVLNIRTLIQDRSNLGFKTLYERAGLPEKLYQATELLITILREMDDHNELVASGIFATKETAARMVQKLTAIVENPESIDNLDYILSLIKHHAVTAKKE